MKNFQMNPRHEKLAFVLMALGLIGMAFGFVKDPARTWANLLVNNLYFLSLALAGLFFIAVTRLTVGAWATGLKRIPEAMMTFLPWSGLLMLLLFFGRHSLYHWSDPEVMAHDPILAGKHAWLNTPFFFVRMALIIGAWSFFAIRLRRISLEQDHVVNAVSKHQEMYRWSAIFIPVFAVTYSLASFDWVMSIEPHWFSTIFAIYNFSGLFMHGVAFIALVVILLREQGYLEGVVNENHLHDLAKLILAFSIFWVSMWVNQYMLIWYTNIPEEIAYYVVRTDRDWNWLFVFNVVFNWGVPFLILLPRASKRSPGVLKRVCILMLVGHWIDLYLMVAPNVVRSRHIGFIEISMAFGYGALFCWLTARALGKAPLVAMNDPYLEESLHHHQ